MGWRCVIVVPASLGDAHGARTYQSCLDVKKIGFNFQVSRHKIEGKKASQVYLTQERSKLTSRACNRTPVGRGRFFLIGAGRGKRRGASSRKSKIKVCRSKRPGADTSDRRLLAACARLAARPPKRRAPCGCVGRLQ